jgi:glycosyltransferase involved in cell wall biosynthesis
MAMTPDRKAPPLRLCRIATVPWTFQTMLREQLRYIASEGMELTLVSSPGPELHAVASEAGAAAAEIAMRREPAPGSDLRSLFRLTNFLRRNRFDIVHSSSPKAGLMTALAGAFTRVPVRLHTFTGQPWVELAGLRRRIPRECDRITARWMTHTHADSPSQRDFLIAEGLVAPERITVVGAGSIAGVDLKRFSLEALGEGASARTRSEMGIPEGVPVIIFLGRVTRQKGVVELVEAFTIVSRACNDVHLVLVGPLEPERDPLPAATLRALAQTPRIHAVGFSAAPEKYLAAADIFCLPSYREGFGSVSVEAAALRLPAVVTRVTGLVDAVVDGVTGLIVPPKDVEALARALKTLLASKELRSSLGNAGRERVVRNFDSCLINEALVSEYRRLASGEPVSR